MMYIGINIILTISLNLVNGYMGEFSVGHAGFMAVGAYIGALLTMQVIAGRTWRLAVSAHGTAGRGRCSAGRPGRGSAVLQNPRRLPGDRDPGIQYDRQVGDRKHRCHWRAARHPRHRPPDHPALGILLDGARRLGHPQFRLFELWARRALDPRGRDRQRPDERQYPPGEAAGVHASRLFLPGWPGRCLPTCCSSSARECSTSSNRPIS